MIPIQSVLNKWKFPYILRVLTPSSCPFESILSRASCRLFIPGDEEEGRRKEFSGGPGWAQMKGMYFFQGRKAGTGRHRRPGNLGGTRSLWRSEPETEAGA